MIVMTTEPNKKENNDNLPFDDDGLVFSQEEMRNFVRGFIIAYLDNKIKINFLANVEGQISETGVKRYLSGDVDMEYNNTKQFLEAIDIVTGKVPATAEVRRHYVRGLFTAIITYRKNGWLEGSFYEFSLEKRIADLESKYANHNEIIHGYIAHLREATGL